MSNPEVGKNVTTKRWYNEQGELHREDGPAVESPCGYKEWYLNDIEYSEQEFNEKKGNVKSTSEKAIRTLIVYTNDIDSPRFLIVDGDFSRFHGARLNYDSIHLREDEFVDWMWDQETGKELPRGWSTDSSIVLSKDFDKFALVSFIP
jgi:hypothetical protein